MDTDAWLSTTSRSSGRRRPARTTRSTRSGSASATDGTEVPARVDAILDAPPRPPATGSSRPAAHADDVLEAGARRGLLDVPRARSADRWARRALRRPGRPGPGGALRVPDPGDARRAARRGRAAAVHAGRGPVLLRHDDAGRPGHLGGGPGRRRLRADGRRRWSTAGSRWPTPCAARPGTTSPAAGYGGSCYLNNAAVAAQALRGAGARPGRGRRRRRAPRQRHGGDLLRPRRRALRLGPRRPGRGLVPARRRATPTRPAPAPASGATLNVPLAPGTGDDGLARRASAELADAVAAHGLRRRWWSRSAWTRPPTTRRARCRSPRRLPRRRASCSARSACRPWWSRRAATTCRPLGGLVAAYLAGHASAARGG